MTRARAQKQYELVNHLANVQETVSDKKYAKDLNGDSSRDEYRAASVMVYDYYPFGMLMPGRSLDTAGICVTSYGVTEIPHFTWINPGTPATVAAIYGSASLTGQTNGGVAASGTGGGLSYVISGITAYSIQLSAYFSAISGTATITAWKGTNTSSTGIQLGSTTTGVTSPAPSLSITPMGTLTTPATITVTITMPTASSRSLFTVDSIGYTKRYDIAVTSVYTRCGSPVDKYEFGFNGQMKSNEIAGAGNHNTALFWEYDTRLGRRWNLDPKKKPWESDYSVFGDNSIANADKLGDEWYKSKGGSPQYYDHKLSNAEREKEGVGQSLGKSFKGRIENGNGIRGHENGTMSIDLKEIAVSGGMGKEGAEKARGEKRRGEAYKRAYELGYMPWMGPDAILINYTAGHYGGFGGKVTFSMGYVDHDWGVYVTPAAGAGIESGEGFSLTFGNKIDSRATGYRGIEGWGSSIDVGAVYVTGSYGHSYNSQGNVSWDFYSIGTASAGVSVSKSYTLPLLHIGDSGFGTVTGKDIQRMWQEIKNSPKNQ